MWLVKGQGFMDGLWWQKQTFARAGTLCGYLVHTGSIPDPVWQLQSSETHRNADHVSMDGSIPKTLAKDIPQRTAAVRHAFTSARTLKTSISHNVTTFCTTCFVPTLLHCPYITVACEL